MAKRHNATKIAAVEALRSQKYADVQKRFKCSSSQLHAWRKQYEAGLLGPKPSTTSDPTERTPEIGVGDRVREAIALLRRAEKEVERLKKSGKLKEADTAHLYAGLALRMLQGDNGL